MSMPPPAAIRIRGTSRGAEATSAAASTAGAILERRNSFRDRTPTSTAISRAAAAQAASTVHSSRRPATRRRIKRATSRSTAAATTLRVFSWASASLAAAGDEIGDGDDVVAPEPRQAAVAGPLVRGDGDDGVIAGCHRLAGAGTHLDLGMRLALKTF